MFQQEAESEGVQPNSNNMPNSISEEPINRLPSSLGGSAHQSQLFYMPNSSSEEPIHPLPSNLRERPQQEQEQESVGVQPNVNPSLQPNHDSGKSANQPDQLSESERTAEHRNYYRSLFSAAQIGDWKTAKRFIDSDPDALTVEISKDIGTVLHIAAQCRQWKFVLRLLKLDVLTPQSIEVQNVNGSTVLHNAAHGGSLKTAKALLEKNPNLLQVFDNGKYPPIVSAIHSRSKELVWYLSKNTRVESPSPPFFIPKLPAILRHLIQSGYHDIALYFVQRIPNLAIAKDEHGNSLLCWLARHPSYFSSGSNLGFFQKWIYKFVCVEIKSAPTHSSALQARSFTIQDTVLGWFKRLLWKAITKLAPSIEIVRDAKMTHECAIELVNHVANELSTMSHSQICNFLGNPVSILSIAIEGGIEEIIQTLLKHYPDLIFWRVRPQRNILQAAIECRQEKIVNIINKISPTTTVALCSDGIENFNTLQLAGKLAPSFKLLSVSGAALQMQRELQWFKEVENITYSHKRELKNRYNEIAKDVFRKEHNELAKQGEKWMKDTANSCMLVSTLIATVLFAAAFTVPGGNINDNGIPIFLRTNTFIVFTISDALGLFSSLTSLLMFLAILTARYAQEDFLESLPKKLIIGLSSLFFSIAAMIIAFGAALTIVLSERWHWVFVPITLVASFPVAIFVMLQLPLFVQMVQATYGESIFRPWPSRV
ncbi:hypothetical protein Ddye_013616 [Dipteronia dyeriana]|uniref:PGG domain-containing protein n=1 Tax=Dipteronia dyeriana TaxID=168575 RepID=A0AAD9X6H8_9ROSI|nr:hypothetical protein Ddye_013616 [Dipteronia dyeriana]